MWQKSEEINDRRKGKENEMKMVFMAIQIMSLLTPGMQAIAASKNPRH